MFRHQLRDIRANGYEFHSNAEPGHKTPEVQARSRNLKGHDEVCGGVEKQRVGKDRTTAKTVSQKSATDRADKKPREQKGNEGRHPVHAKQAGGGGG